MADPTNSSPQSTGSGKFKFELSQEMRLIIAFILMGAVLFLTPLFYKPRNPASPAGKQAQQSQKTEAQQPAQNEETGPKAQEAAAAAAPAQVAASKPRVSPAAPPAEAKKGDKEQLLTVETGLFKVTFSSKGAVVRSWELKRYKDNSGKPVDLVNAPGSAKAGYPMSLVFNGQKPSEDLNQALYVATQSADGLTLDFEYSNGQVSAHKQFQFRKAEYLLDVTSEVSDAGKGLAHRLDWRGGFGDASVTGAPSKMRALYFDGAANKLVSNEAKAAADGPVLVQGDFPFAGIEDTYFAAVFCPMGRSRWRSRPGETR